jgi:hypothetical protein
MFTTIFPPAKDMTIQYDEKQDTEGGPINLIRAIQDHAPSKIHALDIEEVQLQLRQQAIIDERAILKRLLDAVTV